MKNRYTLSAYKDTKISLPFSFQMTRQDNWRTFYFGILIWEFSILIVRKETQE